MFDNGGFETPLICCIKDRAGFGSILGGKL